MKIGGNAPAAGFSKIIGSMSIRWILITRRKAPLLVYLRKNNACPWGFLLWNKLLNRPNMK